jgi:hypothetical protein
LANGQIVQLDLESLIHTATAVPYLIGVSGYYGTSVNNIAFNWLKNSSGTLKPTILVSRINSMIQAHFPGSLELELLGSQSHWEEPRQYSKEFFFVNYQFDPESPNNIINSLIVGLNMSEIRLLTSADPVNIWNFVHPTPSLASDIYHYEISNPQLLLSKIQAPSPLNSISAFVSSNTEILTKPETFTDEWPSPVSFWRLRSEISNDLPLSLYYESDPTDSLLVTVIGYEHNSIPERNDIANIIVLFTDGQCEYSGRKTLSYDSLMSLSCNGKTYVWTRTELTSLRPSLSGKILDDSYCLVS